MNGLIERDEGPPTFFITLSCAEYLWKDIRRLIKQRMEIAGIDSDKYDDNPVKHVNDYSIVVQEYFQMDRHNWEESLPHKTSLVKV